MKLTQRVKELVIGRLPDEDAAEVITTVAELEAERNLLDRILNRRAEQTAEFQEQMRDAFDEADRRAAHRDRRAKP